MVQLFTADEQRARTSQAYIRSAVGDRLRVVDHSAREFGDHHEFVVVQADPQTGLTTRTIIRKPRDATAYQLQTTVTNTADTARTITALSAFTLGFGHDETDLDSVSVFTARSEWLAENRWEERAGRDLMPRLNLALHGQDGRGRYPVTSHGAWSSGENLPAGILQRHDGTAVAWQIETSGPWHWELSQARDGGVLTVLGPTDLEHQFAVTLGPGESFEGVAATIAVSSHSRDGAIAELTRYRRWLRRSRKSADGLPVVYNDFMNTLMGNPTTDRLLPLITAAADAGAECFCIDAGWYADPEAGDWWPTVGEWREAPQRFQNGLAELIDLIHARGMRSGIWLEPEVVGVRSPVAELLPEDAFFHRYGSRVVEHERYQLDLRHPAARAHLDATIDHLVEDLGISYFKLDYNINPGAGTTDGAAGAAAGLLAHTRAFTEWVSGIRARHPQVSIENCSSGAMRADYNLLAVTQLQSTSDQQDFRLYPPIAAAAPATILPEQCGNWAYPDAEMTMEESLFTLVTGLAGRLYLSGFLHELAPEARRAIASAVAMHKAWRSWLSTAEPFWPLGLPRWDDETVCLGLTDREMTRLFVWDRSAEARTIVLPLTAQGLSASVVRLADVASEWAVEVRGSSLAVETVAGLTARVIELA